MSILIKGMEMPDRCFACPMCEVYDAEVNCAISHGSYKEYRDVDEQTAINGRPDWCPLAPVPEHGRLIDKDALLEDIDSNMIVTPSEDGSLVEVHGAEKILAHIAYAPTVIPAEEGET